MTCEYVWRFGDWKEKWSFTPPRSRQKAPIQIRLPCITHREKKTKCAQLCTLCSRAQDVFHVFLLDSNGNWRRRHVFHMQNRRTSTSATSHLFFFHVRVVVLAINNRQESTMYSSQYWFIAEWTDRDRFFTTNDTEIFQDNMAGALLSSFAGCFKLIVD